MPSTRAKTSTPTSWTTSRLAPVFAMVVEGPQAVRTVRMMMGATNPLEAAPGTVRGDFGLDMRRNVVHSADSLASADGR